jgi:ribosomal protein S27E
MEFDPASRQLRCVYCGTTRALPQGDRIEEIPFEEFADRGLELGRLSATALEVACTSCGAVVEFEPAEAAARCPFCAAAIVTQPKAPDPLIAPTAVLPFGFPQTQAAEGIRRWIHGLWFAPNDVKQLARVDGVSGVYLPYWTFDLKVRTAYQGERGTASGSGKDRKITWQQVQGEIQAAFDDRLSPASTAVPRRKLHNLEPWPLPELKPYDPGYLSGFRAQRYQIPLPVAWALAKQELQPVLERLCREAIGGDAQRVLAMTSRYSEVTFKHVLLPVWIGAYRYRDKVYQVLVNAQTGEVDGDRPWSLWKILLLVVAILIVVYLLR